MACKCNNTKKYQVKKDPDLLKVANIIVTKVNSNPLSVRGKTIEELIITDKVHEESIVKACYIKNTLDDIKKKISFAQTGSGLQDYKKYLQIVCKEVDKVVSPDQKCANDWAQGDLDKLKKLKKNCKSGESFSCRKGKCVATKEKEVISEPEKIYGCLDRKASNWYCLTNDCVGSGDDRKPPKSVKPGDCTTTKEYDIKNKYVFCNSQQGCFSDTEHKVTPTLNKVTIKDTGTLEGQPGGVVGHIDSVYNTQKVLIQKANTKKKFLYLKKDGEPQGFYVTSTWDDTLVKEFAAALTIEIFKTKLDGNSTFPFQRVTIFSPDSRLLGHFSIVPNTNVNGEPDSIASLSGKEGSRLINYRLKFHIGTQILDLKNVGVYRNALDSGGGNFDSSYSLDNEGRIIKDQLTEGLVKTLKEKPIGLAKILK